VKQSRGFTLVELLVTLIIMTTLAALALPSYQDYVRRANRSDGYTHLTEIMQAQERFFCGSSEVHRRFDGLGICQRNRGTVGRELL
jgi:type IV pilus assembly protein PilE